MTLLPGPAAMAALHAACFEAPPPWSAADFAGLLDSPHVFALGDGAALALGRAVAGEAELLTLAVAPALRRKGRGAALLAAFEAEARARGAGIAHLEVDEANAAALALYLGAGWRQTGRRPGYLRLPGGAARAACILSKPL